MAVEYLDNTGSLGGRVHTNDQMEKQKEVKCCLLSTRNLAESDVFNNNTEMT